MTTEYGAARRRAWIEPALWLAVYAAGLLAAHACGFQMEVRWFYFQLLPRELLAERLGESLWNLHAQPPLLDLILGGALKLERASGIPVDTSLALLHGLLGGIVVAATVFLLRRLRIRAGLRVAVLALLLLDPAFYLYLTFFFFPLYELLWLSLAALALHRFVERPGPMTYLGVCAPLVALVYTRALFHPLWAGAVLVTAATAGLRRAGAAEGRPQTAPFPPPRQEAGEKRGRRARWAIVSGCALALALLAAWPVKNALRFGVFGFSSWQGFNLSRGLGIEPAPEWDFFALRPAPGVPTPGAPSEGAARDRLAWASSQVPERFRAIPALTLTQKPDGSPNWNHYAIIPLSAELGRQALAAIAERPSRLAEKATRNYLRFTVYPGRHPYRGTLTWRSRTPAATAWLAWYERLTLQAPIGAAASSGAASAPGDVRPAGFRLFPLLVPLLAGATAWRAFRLRGNDPPAAAALAFLLAAALWVVAMALLVDGEEGNRMRFSIQPGLWLGAAAALAPAARSAAPQEEEAGGRRRRGPG